MQSLAIHIHLPNSKKDSIQTLRERIIEATIGFRLRYKAIRGEPIETDWTKFLKKETPESDLIEATQDETTDARIEVISPGKKPNPRQDKKTKNKPFKT